MEKAKTRDVIAFSHNCAAPLQLRGGSAGLWLPTLSADSAPTGPVPGLIYHKILQAPSIHQAHATRGASVEDDLSQAVRSRQARCRSNLSQVILTHESRHASSGTEQPGATFQPRRCCSGRQGWSVKRYGVEEHAGGLVSKSPKVQEAATCPRFHLQKVRQNILSVAVSAQANMKKDDLFRREGKTDSRVGIRTLRTHRLNIGAAITPQTPALSLFASFHLYTF
ncbi:hypothetical protein Bbelb_421090 [Branchiostoma belcheri]|nr:hypothetical protein Bbelb_421090 [Branchiostoma belcheri]